MKVPEHERDRSQKRAGVGAPPLAADRPLLFEEPFSPLEYVRTSGLGGNKLADSSE